MKDYRINKLAKLLVNHSCALQVGEKVLIEAISVPAEIVIELVRETKAVGAVPLVTIKDDRIIRELCTCYSKDDISLMADCELYTLKRVDAFIGIRGTLNVHELSDVPHERMKNIMEYYIRPVHMIEKHQNKKWVALRWPTQSMAERAGMSTEAFEDFFFKACLIDYEKMEAAMSPLCNMMRRTDIVKILGPNDTDVSFSIKGMPHVMNSGRHNIPDGELFTAPIRDSGNGRIHYNVPLTYYGTTFEDICFDLKYGKIIKATCNRSKRINEILDQDKGARYIGEFAFGFNPHILRPMKDILFDEKIMGSIHLTPGNAYKECDNGNKSLIHWDLVLIQTSEMGGGEIYFDGNLIRKDGRFVIEELRGLNPENLK